MICNVHSLGLSGINGYEVQVECYITNGLPAFEIVGLPDAAVKEARERVRAAVKNSGFKFPVSRITCNLAPAGTKKSGTLYDLPILLGILCATDLCRLPKERCAFLGELSLEGAVRPVPGVLPMALAAKEQGIKSLYVPADNAPEATLAQDITVYPVKDVSQLVSHLRGEMPIEPQPEWKPDGRRRQVLDFCDVKGQENAKRALEVAAAGSHNILLVGPPGSGKSMLSRRLPSILPDMTRQEALEATKIRSVLGMLPSDDPLVRERPFRSPHHTISSAGLAGGGSNPRPGEVSLAHNGVLFLDELPEYSRSVLEVMRQPLEDGVVTVSRAIGTAVYPSRFMLLCAMNPCKCGWYGQGGGRCRCTEKSVRDYHARISGPLLDRIDIIVEVPSLPYEDLRRRADGEPSAAIKARVEAARAVQRSRFASPTMSNARMGPKEMERWCALTAEGEALMRDAFTSLGLTARSYDRILRVARTIADLDGAEAIGPMHLAEAVQYRTYDFMNKGENADGAL